MTEQTTELFPGFYNLRNKTKASDQSLHIDAKKVRGTCPENSP